MLRRQGVEIPFETSAGREVIWSKVILVPESPCGTRVRKIGKCLTHHDTMIQGAAVLIQVLPAKQFRHRLLLHYFAFMRTILTLFPSADLNWDICQRGRQPANKRWIWILWGRMNVFWKGLVLGFEIVHLWKANHQTNTLTYRMVVQTFNFLFCLLRKYQCTLVSFPLRKSIYNAIVQIMSKLQEKILCKLWP